MSDTYLSQDDVVQLRDTAVETGLSDPALRNLLFAGILPKYRGTLPILAAPGQQVQSDLNEMNRVERLIDGTVPLAVWLRNATDQLTDAAARDVVLKALDRVARDAAGEPDVAPDVPTGESKEEIIFRDDTVPFGFLSDGETAGSSVARIKVLPYQGGALLQPVALPHSGTGWLIAPGLLVTNHHVVNARKRTDGRQQVADPSDLQLQALGSRSRFDYLSEDDTGAEETQASELVAWDEELDYAVLRLSGAPTDAFLRIASAPLVVDKDTPVALNIIQHPGGEPKRIALRNNLAFEADDTDVRYFTDTRGGSSGSPVLTDDWTVVALHRGTRRVTDVSFQGKSTAFVNVGTQLSAIMRHLREHTPQIHDEIAAAQSR
ncbi:MULTISPECIES: trypsin-like peptidase domain-containing protein [unclassified Streptomyces]|uniref:trypsin-like peptidase domain-containing protein n=1 Tax=unclassified Streptomyces TaxID=2593676 RepID=UPI00203085F5|nr:MULTISPECIES: trypsin-like peptidase domain-containing protein [unclassified Streptomyces]MCM1966379.1 serine protease [Streptomyces sp. G1]MCX5127088.1 serine protease [Streptomyces sp. NBC_00347]